MSSETSKTTVMIIVALLLSGVAYYYVPKTIELENQARVNQNLFAEYESSNVVSIQIEGPVDPEFNLSLKTSGTQTLTIQKTNRGWSVAEFDGYPASNANLISEVASLLNNLKVVEVVSENPSDDELREYGVVAPGTADLGADQVGIRVKLTDVAGVDVGELIVGKLASGAGRGSYYVRSTSEPGIFRVGIDKSQLNPYLLNWVDPNVLDLKAAEGVPIANRGYREVIQTQVMSSLDVPAERDAYRATFQQQWPPQSLALYEEGQWNDVDMDRLRLSPQAQQVWLNGVIAVPNVIYMAKVQRKSSELEQSMEVGVIRPDMKLSELSSMGFSVAEQDSRWLLVGSTGRAELKLSVGMNFHLVFGKPTTEKDLVPLVIYAEAADDSSVGQAPVKESLPEESKDWDDEKRRREQDLIERRYQEALTQYQKLQEQLEAELAKVNQKVAPWIYYIPKEVALQLIPELKLAPAP